MAKTTAKRKATAKKKTATKKPTTRAIKTITKTIKPSMDDIILGATPEEKEVTIYDVFSRNTFFEVENVEQGTKDTVCGKIVETLFGIDDQEEKEQLQEGVDEVTIMDRYHQNAKFIIRKV